jgi:hypothetical protein
MLAIGLQPEIEELECFPNSDDKDWQEAERFWIENMRFLGFKLTNLDNGGIGGKVPSVEARRKNSLAQKSSLKAVTNVARLIALHIGGKHSPEHCKKIGDALRGRKHTAQSIAKMIENRAPRLPMLQEARDRIRSKLKGRKLSAERIAKLKEYMPTLETRSKISAAGKGLKRSPETRKRISVARKGMRFSDAHKESMRISRVGIKASLVTRMKMKIAQKAMWDLRKSAMLKPSVKLSFKEF